MWRPRKLPGPPGAPGIVGRNWAPALDPRRVPERYMVAVREMARILSDWKRDQPESPPRFALPPPGAGIIVAIKLVYPVLCQNAAAKELFERCQDMGRIVGGEALDPTLFQFTCALAAAGLEPYEFRAVEEFQQCKMKMERPGLLP